MESRADKEYLGSDVEDCGVENEYLIRHAPA